jgi:hypothetical protein
MAHLIHILLFKEKGNDGHLFLGRQFQNKSTFFQNLSDPFFSF